MNWREERARIQEIEELVNESGCLPEAAGVRVDRQENSQEPQFALLGKSLQLDIQRISCMTLHEKRSFGESKSPSKSLASLPRPRIHGRT